MMSPSEVAVRKAVTRDGLARHCRRKTCGTDATVTAIENLLLSLTGATDSFGVLLLKDEMTLGMQSLFEQFRVPMEYTGEANGVDYLFQQKDMAFLKDITAAIDEGFDDMVEDDTSEADAMGDVDSAPWNCPLTRRKVT